MMDSYSEITKQRDASGLARAYTHWIKALVTSAKTGARPFDVFMDRLPRHLKSAVAGMTTDPTTLINSMATAFQGLIVRATILGRLAGFALPVPPNIRVPLLSSTGTAQFVAQGAAVPAVLLNRDLHTLEGNALGLLVVLTQELADSVDDRSVSTVERHLLRQIAEGEDTALLGAAAAVAGHRPAGLMNGVSSSGGGSPLALDEDIRTLWAAVRSGDSYRPFFITGAEEALYLRSLADDGHGSLFSNVRIDSTGDIAGVPLLISKAATGKLILLDASLLGYVDDGVSVESSRVTSIQMDDTPTANSGTATGSSAVSLFQSNAAALKVIRHVDWKLADSDAIAYVDLPV